MQFTMNNHSLLFIGCYTRGIGGGEGIYTYRFNAKNGQLIPVTIFKSIKNPSFLTVSHGGQYLYAVIETGDFEKKESGGVAAFKINQQTGELTLLNQKTTGGIDPCHITIDHTNQCLLISHYTSGNVAVFQLNSDGSLSERSQFIQYHGSSIHPRQNNPHAHSAVISADNRYVFIQDFGVDCIRQYLLDPIHGKITENKPAIVKIKPGAGPRHFVFHPHQPLVYVVNELNNTVVVYDYAIQTGLLTQKQTITTLPTDFHGENITADIHITADGRFLYVSNRGHNSLAIFAINKNTGELNTLGHQVTLGKWPRNFFITPDDQWLLCANQETNNIVSFYRDKISGQLTPAEQQTFLGKPVCIISNSQDKLLNPAASLL